MFVLACAVRPGDGCETAPFTAFVACPASSSLDYHGLATRITDLVSPNLADWFLIVSAMWTLHCGGDDLRGWKGQILANVKKDGTNPVDWCAVRLKPEPSSPLRETMQNLATVRVAVAIALTFVACTLQGCEESSLDFGVEMTVMEFLRRLGTKFPNIWQSYYLPRRHSRCAQDGRLCHLVAYAPWNLNKCCRRHVRKHN